MPNSALFLMARVRTVTAFREDATQQRSRAVVRRGLAKIFMSIKVLAF